MNQSEEFQKSQTAIDYNWKKSAKSAIEKLDIVLSALDHEGASPEGYSDILKKDSLVAVSISMRELHQIIQKLQTDKYVDLIQSANSTTKSFYITIEGEFFIQEGGYRNKRKKEKRLKTWETIKFWAVVLNGIILLFLSVMSYTNTNESEELNKNISQKDSIIADYKLKFSAVTSKMDNSIYQPIKDTSISKNNNISDSMSK